MSCSRHSGPTVGGKAATY